MKKLFLSLLLMLISVGSAMAAPAFRQARYNGFKVLIPAEGSIVMIGNSITDMHVWGDVFKDADGNYLPIVNRGNSGTFSTEQSENLESYLINHPSKVFMMIGTNDIASNGLAYTPDQLMSAVSNMVTRIHKRSPQTEVYLYPILNNTTGNRVRATWEAYNAKLQEYVAAQRSAGNTWLTFIDFYQAMYAVGQGGNWSYDSLHPTVAGYKIWAHAILPYLGDGVTSVYDDIEGDLTGVMSNGGAGGSSGGSGTQYSVRPMYSTDILVFGDDEIKTGEWNELLGNYHVKNRATGWDKGGSIDMLNKMITATFANTGAQKECPKACFVYTGTTNCTGSGDMEDIKSSYTALIETLKEKAPNAKIYLMALHPISNTTNNARVVALNTHIQSLADAKADDNVKFVDTYTDLYTGSAPNGNYISGDFLYGRGYVKFAQKMKEALLADFPSDTYTVITDEEAATRVEQSGLRNEIGKKIFEGRNIVATGKVGGYTDEAVANYNEAVEGAYTLLNKASITADEKTAAINAMSSALNAVVAPTAENTNGKFFTFCTPNRGNRYLTNNGAGQTMTGRAWTGYDNQVWKLQWRTNDNSFDLISVYDNSYLTITSSNQDTPITTSQTAPATGWTFSDCNTPGLFTIVSGGNQLNQQNQDNYNILNWGGGTKKNDDGCNYAIAEIEEANFTHPLVEEGHYYNIAGYIARNGGTTNYVLYDGTTRTTSHTLPTEGATAIWKAVKSGDGWKFRAMGSESVMFLTYSGADATGGVYTISQGVAEGCVTMRVDNTNAASSEAGEMGGGWKSANNTVQSDAYGWSTDWKFIPVDYEMPLIEDGKTYTIQGYVLPDSRLYITYNGTARTMVATATKDATQQWTAHLSNGKYYFESVQKPGSYLKFAANSDGVSNDASSNNVLFTVAAGTSEGTVSLYGTCSAGQKFMASSADGSELGSFYASSQVADATTSGKKWSTNFILTKVQKSEPVQEEKALPFKVSESIENAKWNNITLVNTAKAGEIFDLYSDGSKLKETKNATAEQKSNDEYKWAFLESGDGYIIYSKKGHYLKAATAANQEVAFTTNADEAAVFTLSNKAVSGTDRVVLTTTVNGSTETYLSHVSASSLTVNYYNGNGGLGYAGNVAEFAYEEESESDPFDGKSFIIKSAYTGYTGKALYNDGTKLAWKDYVEGDKSFVFKMEKQGNNHISWTTNNTNLTAEGLYAIKSPIISKYAGIAAWAGKYNFCELNTLNGDGVANDALSGIFALAPIAGTSPQQYNIATKYKNGSDYSTISLTNAASTTAASGDATTYNIWGTANGTEAWILVPTDSVKEEELPDRVEYTINSTTFTNYRNGAATSGTNFASEARSNNTPTLTFKVNGSANNQNWNGTDLAIFTGGSSCTYILQAPTGYVIESYSLTATNKSDNTEVMTLTVGGNTYVTTTAQQISANIVNEQTVTFVEAGPNKGIVLSDFVVTIKKDVPEMPIISTNEKQHWYYITNAATNDNASYAKNKVMYYSQDDNRIKFGDKTFDARHIWSFWEGTDGKLAIKNYKEEYFGTPGNGAGGDTAFGKSANDAANYVYTIAEAHGYFTITAGTGAPLHAQNSGSVVVRWNAEAGNASLWRFNEVDCSDPDAKIGSTIVQQGRVTTGIGNKNLPILRSTLNVNGLQNTVDFQGVSGTITGTGAESVENVRVYFATNARELVTEEEATSWRDANAELFGEAVVEGNNFTCTAAEGKQLEPGKHYLWIAYDIAESAEEGKTVDAAITSYNVAGETVEEKNGNPANEATIFLSEGTVLMPKDKGVDKTNGSTYYRIPAITSVMKNGKPRLVTLTDDRREHGADLPSHCYIVAQYSDDLGKTWSEPQCVAGTADKGGDYGHGDASIVTNRDNGEIVGIMTCSTYGNGFFGSTSERPQTWKTIISKDGGETWSDPVDHTESLYAKNSPNPTWKAGFSGSGAALQKRDGTLVSSFVNREPNPSNPSKDVQNFYFFMSKDGGKHWYVSGTSGTSSADEPKTLERNNGDLAISVRSGGFNFHNVTSDNGATWKYQSGTRFSDGIRGNACDGEYMVWCSTLEGNEHDIAFQTIPNNDSRQNVSIALSTDEGEHFGTPKTICPSGSAYSAATVLPDGTLGVYYEENGVFGGYTMRFVRFSLKWASNGEYSFDNVPFKPIASNRFDVNNDGKVDKADAEKVVEDAKTNVVIEHKYTNPTRVSDVNYDGKVNVNDATLIIDTWKTE